MFCESCGNQVREDMHFCDKCGADLWKKNQYNQSNNYEQSGNMQTNFSTCNAQTNLIEQLYQKEKIGMYIWIGVVCYQVLIGFWLPSSWAFAAWNAFACYQTYIFCEGMRKNPVGLYKRYKDSLASDIIFLVLNLVLAGVIGAVGACYDLYIRQFAMNNGEQLIKIEQEFLSHTEEQQSVK